MNNNTPVKVTYAALFSLLQSVPLPSTIGAKLVPNSSPPVYTWQRTTRTPLDWDKVAEADQPFMLLHGGPIEAEERSVFTTATYTLKAYCWVYFRASSEIDPATPTEDTIFDIYNAIEQTLQPVPGEKQTLQGTIYH